MSEGERTCKMFGNCTNFTEVEKCNKECDFYATKLGEETPEEVEAQIEIEAAMARPDVKLEVSTLPKFDTKFEFMVIKKHVFTLLKVTPKKITLRLAQVLKDSDGLSDGCYVFKDQQDRMLDPHKTFLKFKREAKIKRVKEAVKKAKEE